MIINMLIAYANNDDSYSQTITHFPPPKKQMKPLFFEKIQVNQETICTLLMVIKGSLECAKVTFSQT